MRKVHSSKHRYDNDSASENEYRSSTKVDIHCHKRKHRKHRHKDEELERSHYKDESDDSSLKNPGEIIEIHDSSSEEECNNGTLNHNNHRTDSHRHRHHEREERKHKKRRKRSRSNSYVREKEVESGHSKHKKTRGNGDRSTRNVSESDSDCQLSNDHRKRKSREGNSSDCKERKSTGSKRKNDVDEKIKIKSEKDIKVERESKDRQPSRQNIVVGDSRRRNANGEPSGRSNSRRRGSKEKEEHEWGGKADKSKAKKPAGELQKPNFGLSGKLTEDTNTFNGVVIKYSEPPEARMPKKRWRLYPFKGDTPLPPLYIHRQSAYLLGRDRKVADMPIDHPSCSKQHAALQYRLISYERPDGSIGKQIRLYIIDLESANGTFINNNKIEPRKYVELFEKDVIKFGFSSREYVLLHEHSKDDNPDPDDT